FGGLERLRHSTPTVPLNLIRIFLRCPVDRSDLAFQSLLRIGDARDTERNYPRHSDASDSHHTSPSASRHAKKRYGVFGRVAYSAVARLNSIGTSFFCNTHNSHYRCRRLAIWYSSQLILLRNADI